jgi:hypothetical protein
MHPDAFTEYEIAQRHQLNRFLLAGAAGVLLVTSAATLAYWAEIAATLTVLPAVAIPSVVGAGGVFCLRQSEQEALAAASYDRPHAPSPAMMVDYELQRQNESALSADHSQSLTLASHINLTPSPMQSPALQASKEAETPQNIPQRSASVGPQR